MEKAEIVVEPDGQAICRQSIVYGTICLVACAGILWSDGFRIGLFSVLLALGVYKHFSEFFDFRKGRLKFSTLSFSEGELCYDFGKKRVAVENIRHLHRGWRSLTIQRISPDWADPIKINIGPYAKADIEALLGAVSHRMEPGNSQS